jgi:hypothetical protein
MIPLAADPPDRMLAVQAMEAVAFSIRQSLALPSIELLRFGGDPLEYAEFMINFTSHVEANVPDPVHRLTRLLGQCYGKAKDAIRSCVSLPGDQGYETAKGTLLQNFGMPYLVANAHIRKLKDLRIKKVDATNLLDFARAIECTSRALAGLGSEYSTRLDNEEFIKMLMRKLPTEDLRKGWCSRAGTLISCDMQVKLKHFYEFVHKAGVKLNHTFAEDLEAPKRIVAVVAKQGDDGSQRRKTQCVMCGLEHGVWNCSIFKDLIVEKRWNVVREHKLCISCLAQGHLASNCKRNFKCRVSPCGKSHHTLLHNVPKREWKSRQTSEANNSHGLHEGSSNQHENTVGQVSCCSEKGLRGVEPEVCFKIVPVRVKGPRQEIETYAFLDSGSDVTLCLESLVDQLGLPYTSTDYKIHTISGEKQVLGKRVSLTLDSLDGRNSFSFENVLTSEVIPVDETNLVSLSSLSNWKHLQGLDLQRVPKGKVTMLIGLDHPEVVEQQAGVRRGERNAPIAIKTPFGWTVCGKMRGSNRDSNARVNFATTDFERRVSQQLDHLYNADFKGSLIEEEALSIDDLKAKEIMDSSVKLVNGHYQISLPFKKVPPPLPDNLEVVKKRLNSLKWRLERDEGLKTSYFNVLKQYELEGASRLVSKSVNELPEDAVRWYIPHHGVWSARKPEEPRVVFDCAAEHEGTSLNDNLLKGPENTSSLVGVLLRFRVRRIAVVGDIKRMFHQVYVPDEERPVLRYLWWQSLDFSEEPAVFEMLVHLFGATSSPSVCGYALRKTASDNEGKYSPSAQNAVKKNFYVDDFVASFDDVNEAICVSQEVASLVGEGGLKLTKWNSNSRKVVESFPVEERAPAVRNIDLELGNMPDEKILGIQWSLEKDLLAISVKPQEFPRTRRGVLSSIAVVYDPLGLASPFLLPGREIHQELCRRNLSWDEALPEDLERRWESWLRSLYLLVCEIPRCFVPKCNFKAARCELHNFADASENHGYGTVSYLRFVDEFGNIHCSFLYGKSRVRPLRGGITVPKLELSAATVLVSISCMLIAELEHDLRIDEVFFWSDSMIVLSFLKATEKRQDKFVANRVARILEGSTAEQWHHVASKNNPADLASRGMDAHQGEKIDRWLNGPAFLHECSDGWSFDKDTLQQEKIVGAIEVRTNDFWMSLIEKYSTWTRLVRIVGRLYEVAKKWKKFRRMNLTSGGTVSPLNVQDVEAAEGKLISLAQEELWDRQKDMKQLKVENVDGHLCVGGRLKNAHVPDETKHPRILPSNHRITHLLIVHVHETCGHLGINYTLSKLRERFWVLKGVAAVKRALRKCFVCRRMHGKAGVQLLASLPSARVNIENPESRFPFSSVGVDFFGPFHVSLGPRTRGRRSALHKRYGCIFTCLRIRAVHIEMVTDLSSDSFLEAVTRFVARRGAPFEFFSDNGTNFKGASADVIDALKSWNQSEVQDRLANQRISWHFNTPTASHQGGVWERVIRSIRRILDSLISNSRLTDETLCTLFCEVEKILNDRPITRVSSDPTDLEALTPNHILLLRGNSSLQMDPKSPGRSRGRLKQAQDLANQFWQRWVAEYLPNLQRRQKWTKKERNLKKGDLVLITDGNEPRGHWKKGLVTEVFEDKEGQVRRVTLKTESGVLLRSVHKLCLLEEELLGCL